MSRRSATRQWIFAMGLALSFSACGPVTVEEENPNPVSQGDYAAKYDRKSSSLPDRRGRRFQFSVLKDAVSPARSSSIRFSPRRRLKRCLIGKTP